MQVVTDSLLTAYDRMGQTSKGNTLVFLHGWGDTSASSLALRRQLSKQYDVIAVDLPGFGGTQAPAEAWDLDAYVRFVAAFLKKIGVRSVYAFIGHSNGGSLVIRGLADGSLTAERAVLLASAGIRTPKSLRNRLLKVAAKTTKVLIKPLPKSVRHGLRSRAYGAIGSDYLVAPHLQESFKRVVAEDVRTDAAQLSMPVLLVYGEADTDTPVWFGELYHQLMVDSTLVVLPGAGHFVYLDRPADTFKQIEDFLA